MQSLLTSLELLNCNVENYNYSHFVLVLNTATEGTTLIIECIINFRITLKLAFINIQNNHQKLKLMEHILR